ncbi:MAG: hypothetical protein LKJ13_01065 [Clostridia bacterium]|nr:hypothetical protein [Clostridia bacterium]MCI2000057.1 hypothetical protein [Clostridia bacterium]MCI2014409.1 hypothetical protein [Clostridia bacterium]
MTDFNDFCTLDDLMKSIEYIENMAVKDNDFVLNENNENKNDIFGIPIVENNEKEKNNDDGNLKKENPKNVSSVFDTFYTNTNKFLSEISSNVLTNKILAEMSSSFLTNSFNYEDSNFSNNDSVLNLNKSKNTDYEYTNFLDSTEKFEKNLNNDESFSENSNIKKYAQHNEYFGDNFYNKNTTSDLRSQDKNINIVLNNYSNIYNKSDEDNMINCLAEKIAEYVAYGGEGTHI